MASETVPSVAGPPLWVSLWETQPEDDQDVEWKMPGGQVVRGHYDCGGCYDEDGRMLYDPFPEFWRPRKP
jgi:hypothetical protein